MPDSKNRVQIVIPHEPNKLTGTALIESIRDGFKLLNEADRAGKEEKRGRQADWIIVDANMNSPFHLLAERRDSEKAIHQVITWAREISNQPVRPADMSDEALGLMKTLCENRVEIISDDFGKAKFDEACKRNIDAITGVQADIEMISSIANNDLISISGTLEDLVTHGSYFNIYDPLNKRPIRCTCDDIIYAIIKNQIPESIHSPHRVTVTGYATYRENGDIERIKTVGVDLIEPQHELPFLKDIIGIDLTNGIDSVEHIRKVRDGE